MDEISYDDFSKLELKTGIIKEAIEHPDADKLLLLKVDIGEKEIQLVAGIKASYAPEDAIGKHIVVLTNLKPRMIRGHLSEGMLLAASGSRGVSVLTTDREVEAGSQIR